MQYVLISDNEDTKKTEQAYRILEKAFSEIRQLGGYVVTTSTIVSGHDVVPFDLAPKFGKLSMGETRAIYRRLCENKELP